MTTIIEAARYVDHDGVLVERVAIRASEEVQIIRYDHNNQRLLVKIGNEIEQWPVLRVAIFLQSLFSPFS